MNLEDDDLMSLGLPTPVGPYSPAVRVADMVFVSGQLPLSPEGEILEGPFELQVQQLFFNIQQVLAMAGADIKEVVKFTIYLTDMNDYDVLNQVMTELLTEPFPARVVIGVNALPKGARICADAVVYVSQ